MSRPRPIFHLAMLSLFVDGMEFHLEVVKRAVVSGLWALYRDGFRYGRTDRMNRPLFVYSNSCGGYEWYEVFIFWPISAAGTPFSDLLHTNRNCPDT